MNLNWDFKKDKPLKSGNIDVANRGQSDGKNKRLKTGKKKGFPKSANVR